MTILLGVQKALGHPTHDWFYPTAHMRYRYCLNADCRAEQWFSRIFRRWQNTRTWW